MSETIPAPYATRWEYEYDQRTQDVKDAKAEVAALTQPQPYTVTGLSGTKPSDKALYKDPHIYQRPHSTSRHRI